MQQGLVLYPGGGTADGSSGAHILLAPRSLILLRAMVHPTSHADASMGAGLPTCTSLSNEVGKQND